MNTFVIIFRRRAPALADRDRQRLNEETAAWARTRNAAGHKLDPRILSADVELRGPEASVAAKPDAWSLSALLFLEARDLSEAAEIAGSHPGLHYGFNIEVRPWAAPGPGAQSAKPAVAQ